MIGYTYLTEQEAINARQICNDFYGYPKEGCDTQHWIDYEYSALDGFYYMIASDGVEELLGVPIEFIVTEESPYI